MVRQTVRGTAWPCSVARTRGERVEVEVPCVHNAQVHSTAQRRKCMQLFQFVILIILLHRHCPSIENTCLRAVRMHSARIVRAARRAAHVRPCTGMFYTPTTSLHARCFSAAQQAQQSGLPSGTHSGNDAALLASKVEGQLGNKISLMFTVNDGPGSLSKILELFQKYNVNLSRIESRPQKRCVDLALFRPRSCSQSLSVEPQQSPVSSLSLAGLASSSLRWTLRGSQTRATCLPCSMT